MDHAHFYHPKSTFIVMMAIAVSCPIAKAVDYGRAKTTGGVVQTNIGWSNPDAPISSYTTVPHCTSSGQSSVASKAMSNQTAPNYTHTTSAAAAQAPDYLDYGQSYGRVSGSSAEGTSATGPYYVSPVRSAIANKALARRSERTQEAMTLLEEGRRAYQAEDYEKALQDYKRALDVLPNAPVTDQQRQFITESVGDASVAVAHQYAKVGRYDEARQLLLESLKINPNNKLAKRELEFMDDPIRTNPALTPQHAKNVEEVNRLLHMGYGYYDLGQFDEARAEFAKVLKIDKYNTAAQRGIEAANRRRSSYYRAAYDTNRSNMLAEVDKAWETPIVTDIPVMGQGDVTGVTVNTGTASNLQKLKSIILPVVEFEDTTVEDAIQFLRSRSVEFDTNPGPSGERGINFVINDSQPTGGAAATPDLGSLDLTGGDVAPAPVQESAKKRVIKELKLRNVPMQTVLNMICDATGLRPKVEDYAVTLLPAGGVDTDIYTRTYVVPPNFLSALASSSGGEDVDSSGGDIFSSEAPSRPKRPSIEQLLKSAGVTFENGASVNYLASASRLIVRNTKDQLDFIEQLIDEIKSGENNTLVKLSTKFVEVNQDNTEELSFDWVVNPFSVNNGRSLFMGGGTATGSNTSASDFVGAPSGVTGWPISGDPVSSATSGLRSGTGAVSKDTISTLLNTPNRASAGQDARAPGILSMTGIYDEGSFQMIMRGLDQKKGSDVLTAPSILVRPGETEASIEIIRQFIYPEEYEAPQLPDSVGSQSNANLGTSSLLGGSSTYVNSFPVTPATPSSWAQESLGVVLKVKVDAAKDGLIEVSAFDPQIVEFEGFVNYGSPIQSTGIGSDGVPVSITLTENRIEMPIFQKRVVHTSLSIYDGYTVGIGGLITESVQVVEDKVPIFGDLPLVGRFFRSNAESHQKKNLMIFVTAEIVDPTGKSVRDSSQVASPVAGGALTDEGLLPPVP